MPVKTMAQRQKEAAAELANPSGKGWRNAVPAKRPRGIGGEHKMTRSALFLEQRKLFEKIAVLELSGTPLDTIALKLRISKKELRRYRGEPMYRELLEQGSMLTKKRLETKLEALTDQALDVHGEIMKKPRKGDPIRLAAASSVLDRTLAKPRDAQEPTRPVSEHHLHLHAAPAEVATAAKRFRAAAILAGHLPPDVAGASSTEGSTEGTNRAEPRTESAPAESPALEAEGEDAP